jgi:hypothetical protein
MSNFRGQTTFDFAIGISIFLSVLLFVFTFVPTILEPFTVGAQEHTVAVDRVANELTQDVLGSPEQPNVLDRRCTVNFTTSLGGPAAAACRFGDDTILTDRFGLREGQQVNVTISGNTTAAVAGSNVLCWDRDDRALREQGSGDCGGPEDVRLDAGGQPPGDNAATVAARRVASLWGEDVTVRVVMW